MKIGCMAVTAALIIGAAGASESVAGMVIAGVMDQNSVVPSPGVDRANTFNGNMTLRGQHFSIGSAMEIETISILANSPDGDNVTLWITNGLGADSEVLYEGTHAVQESDGTAVSWFSFELTNAILSQAGEYYVLIGSDGSGGFRMNKTSTEGAAALGNRAFALLPAGSDFLGAEFAHFADGNVLAMQIIGSAIPAPGSVALMGVSGLLLAGRRRR